VPADDRPFAARRSAFGNDFAPTERAAVRADAVRTLGHIALRALDQVRYLDGMMRPPPSTPPAGNSSLGNRSHSAYSFILKFSAAEAAGRPRVSRSPNHPLVNVPPRGRARWYYRGKHRSCQGCATGAQVLEIERMRYPVRECERISQRWKIAEKSSSSFSRTERQSLPHCRRADVMGFCLQREVSWTVSPSSV